MTSRVVDKEKILHLFTDLQSAFPHVEMKLERNHPHVDLNMDIPQQNDLKFTINVNLQGDELHLCAGHFWLEWFPCHNADVIRKFREAVYGLLS